MENNLITGIGGFVASHLADYLLEMNEKVIGSYRWNEDLQRIKHLKEKIEMVEMDLNDLSSCVTVLKYYKPTYIYHLAAQSYVSDSFIYPVETIRINTIGTVNLLEAIRLIRLDDASFDPIVHVCSSSEVYGLVEEKDIPITEECRLNPSNPYAVGKVGEDMAALMYWTNYRIKTIRTRMFTHTGPRRTMMSAECNFARQIAEFEKKDKSFDNNPFKIGLIYNLKHGNLNSIRTWADVRDAVRAYYLLVRKCKPGEVYNIGGNTSKTIGEVLDYLISLSIIKDKIKKEQDPKLLRPYDVTLQLPNSSKFINETGWKPIYTFEQTMQDLLNWWRENI
jgi:GDP-mannose 4,6-dehydratase